MRDSFRDYFMDIALTVAKKSKDPSIKVGCVIAGIHNNILSTGYNGLARNVPDNPEWYENRDFKLKTIVHAEANAVAAAARCGVSLFPSTAIITLPPCTQCAALLIQAGVGRIICPPPNEESRWYDLNKMAEAMLFEAKVKVEYYENEHD